MTLEAWSNSYEAYLAIFRGIFFVLALYTSIISGVNTLGILVAWHNRNCQGAVNWVKVPVYVTILWSIYALLGYCIEIGRL